MKMDRPGGRSSYFMKMKMKRDKREIDWTMIIIALLALMIGIILYVHDRPSSDIYFVPAQLSLYREGGLLFGAIGNHLPTFVHVFAFCLLTAGILGSGRVGTLFICLFWLITDSMFEIAQSNEIANLIVPYIPGWFEGIPFLENTGDYFLNGRFDNSDLVSIVVGAITAYLLALFIHSKDKSHVPGNLLFSGK